VEKKIRQCHLEVKEACQGSEVLLTWVDRESDLQELIDLGRA
jgi:hypothetical protein